MAGRSPFQLGESTLEVQLVDKMAASCPPRRTVLAYNIPEMYASEDILESLFESKKKGGGGIVDSVVINTSKGTALVTFENEQG